MIRRPPRSTRTDTLLPYTTLFRSEIDRIRVVGKQAPERIFAHLGGPDMTSSDAFLAFKTRFAAFLELYRLGQWNIARERVYGLHSFTGILPVVGLVEAFERRLRLEERRGGKEWVGPGRSRRWRY